MESLWFIMTETAAADDQAMITAFADAMKKTLEAGIKKVAAY